MPGLDFYVRPAQPASPGTVPEAPKAAANDPDFSFDDLLDIVNPLHHFPVISTLYKHLTGDTIGVPEKILGDTLYGGLMGLASSVGDAIFTELTGKSVGDTIYAFVIGDDDAQSAVATATNPIDVKPASSDDIALPGFSFMDFDSADETPAMPSPEVAQRAIQAYRNTSKFLSY